MKPVSMAEYSGQTVRKVKPILACWPTSKRPAGLIAIEVAVSESATPPPANDFCTASKPAWK